MTQDRIDKAVNRATEIIARAEAVNAAQYTHGINSTKSSLKWHLKELSNTRIEQRAQIFHHVWKIEEETLKLAGYLYALNNNI